MKNHCIYIFEIHFQEDCRDLICPNGAIRTPDGCKLFAKTWHVSGYEIHVIMTPVSELFIPLTEFNNLTERVHNINDWLDTKGLDINHLIMYAEETEMDNKTLLGAMNMRLGSDKYPLNAQEMLKTIETSVSKEWSITLNKIVYPYKVQFDKYETFVQTGSVNKDKWYGEDPSPSSAMAESFMLPKVYTLVLYIRRMTGLNINKMFYCEKIELLENEWSGAFDGIWLNVTGSGNDTFFGDGEFFYEKDVFGTKVVTVQICLDDFMSQFVSDKNTAPSLDHSIYVFLYLELVFIFA